MQDAFDNPRTNRLLGLVIVLLAAIVGLGALAAFLATPWGERTEAPSSAPETPDPGEPKEPDKPERILTAPEVPDVRIDVTGYVFRLKFGDENDEIFGEADVVLRFTEDGVSDFSLQLAGRSASRAGKGMTVRSVAREGAPVPYAHEGDQLRIRMKTPPKAWETRKYTVTYHGIPADGFIISRNLFAERTFFGDNWPDRARHWLPTKDHPSDKACVDFIVTAPANYKVVGNGLRLEEKKIEGGHRLTHWREIVPIPTKVMVIGAARFTVRKVGQFRDVPIHAWVFEGNPERVFRDFVDVPDVLKFFEEKIGPYPYGKLDLVQSRTRWGGMENPGVIFLNEKSVTGRGASEEVLVHEIAHQWFGDSVTEADWTHLWLSEGIATYITRLYNEARYGTYDFASEMRKDRERIFKYERKRPREKIVDPSVFDPRKRLTVLMYYKASWVLHMLRHRMGSEAFWLGLRGFHEKFRHANATTGDFRTAMEAVGKQDLSRFFDQWLCRPGHPVLVGRWEYDASSKLVKIEIDQVQPEGDPYELLCEVAIHGPGKEKPLVRRLELSERRNVFTLPHPRAPHRMVFDPDPRLLAEVDWRRKKMPIKGGGK
ncbi:MAG: M1 family metallopeptidase [Planctomycetota bacterium]|jgi:aminopeptidase N